MDTSDQATESLRLRKKYKTISLEERQKIEGFLRQDKSYYAIGNLLKRSKFAIRNEVLRGGGREKYTANEANEISIKNQSRRHLRGFSTKETQDIIAAFHEGNSIYNIAARYSSHANTIQNLIMRHDPLKGDRGETIRIHERVISLEMQLEILSEQIKEITQKLEKR